MRKSLSLTHTPSHKDTLPNTHTHTLSHSVSLSHTRNLSLFLSQKHQQCARYLRKSVREGHISSAYREKPEDDAATTLVAFKRVETSHHDTLNIIANAARRFRILSTQGSYYGN